MEKSDHRQRRLLRARSERPRDRRPAEFGYELASSDVECHLTRPTGVMSVEHNITPQIGGPKFTIQWEVQRMSASLIGRLGSSTFRLSTAGVDDRSRARASSESAPRPFRHGIRRRGGTIFRSALPSGRTAGPSRHANSPHPSSREGHHSTAGWSRVSFYWIWSCTVFMLRPRLVPGSSGIRCRQPICGA